VAQASDVTIIIPAYCKSEEEVGWLRECLDSALIQGCEVVVCDDESPVSIELVRIDYRVRWIRTHHGGVSHARNIAITAAGTDLILPLDGDDRLAPRAVAKMLEYWDGEIPVYPDIRKFGIEDVPHYELFDFKCEHLVKYVGFTSVNVLHTKKQWEESGRYDETLEFYEDGEYNARLMSRFCAVRCPFPVVEYRMHPKQRTRQYDKESSIYAKKILNQIRRTIMPCASCGGHRKTTSSYTGGGAFPQNIIQDPTHMPLTQDGLVLCQYVGGQGRGKHYYEGMYSKIVYRVSWGVYVYADPRDTRAASENTPSFLVRYEKK